MLDYTEIIDKVFEQDNYYDLKRINKSLLTHLYFQLIIYLIKNDTIYSSLKIT